MVVKVDQRGNVVSYGRSRNNDPAMAVALARQQQANRALAHGVTGRLSNIAVVANVKDFKAVKAFVDADVSGGTGGTKATLDASIALVNDALAAIFTDANAIAALLGIPQVTYAGGGTPASPVNAITGAGVAAATSATAANMNPIRIQIDKNMVTAAAFVNKIARAIGHEPVFIHVNPEVQPPPDSYGAGGTGVGGGTSTAGSSVAFGKDAPFSNPTPAITEDSGTFAATGVTKVDLDAALDIWRFNAQTLVQRLAVYTNTVAALTDNSTGVAGSAVTEMALFANAAAVGTDLADKTTTEAEMTDIKNAIASLFGKANELAAGLGATQRTYDGGGTVSNTLAAIAAVTGAATGVQATEMNAWRTVVHTAIDALVEHVNEVAEFADVAQITRVTKTASFPFDNPVNPQQEKSDLNATTRAQSRFLTSRLSPAPGSAVPVTGGTAADPGVKKAAMDTALGVVKNNLATVAAKVNAIRSALAAPLVKIV